MANDQKRREDANLLLGASIAGSVSALIVFLLGFPILASILFVISLFGAGQAVMRGGA
jgi:hypothetical protein